MARTRIRIIAPDVREDAEGVIDLIAKVFGGYYRFRDYGRRAYVLNSTYDWNVSRLGIIGTHVVTHWGVWGYPMRIGAARVRCGGIGGVATDADYRQKGLMARTARASIDAMREAGYDFSVLFGIDNFYHRFGYVRAWSDTAYIVRLSDLPAPKPAVRPRKFTTWARDDIVRIYEREHAGMTGTALRPTYLLEPWPGHLAKYLWTDARGRTTGYVLVAQSGQGFECAESGGDVEQVLRVVAMLARTEGAQEVRFSTFPYHSALAKRLRRGNCREELSHRHCGGAMVRTINLASALQKMAGELSRRLRGSPMALWRGDLLVADAREEALLAIRRGQVRVLPGRRSKHAISGGDEIAQFLIGTAAPSEIAEAAGTRLTGDARKLADALFPAQHPQLCMADRY